jgi:hypothetical protein
MSIFKALKIVKWQEDEGVITCNNLTILNFILILIGPLKESSLTKILLIIQVVDFSKYLSNSLSILLNLFTSLIF